MGPMWYRQGDAGRPIADIQERLAALGLTISDPIGTFGEGTRDAVQSLQRKRGLPADGIVGPMTWRAIVEAGYSLGDRPLSLRGPMVRGQDVAELQRLLNRIGFDAGKEDGILGTLTHKAVLAFQHDRCLAEDGIVGPVVVRELGLVGRAIASTGRHQVEELQWLRGRPRSVAGLTVYLDPACRDSDEALGSWEAATAAAESFADLGAHPVFSRAIDTSPADRVRAQRANRSGAQLVIGFALPHHEAPAVYSFGSEQSHSLAGKHLAVAVGRQLDLPALLRSVPILRETAAPAVLVETTPLDHRVGTAVSHALETFFGSDDLPSGTE